MDLAFRLLGDVAVIADGRPLRLGGTRQRSILALLVLQRNRSVSTDQLASRLWPDEPPISAVKTIQVYVSRIRRLLGPAADRLTSSATGYRLAVDDDELDVARFERGLRLAREGLAVAPEASTATLEAILGLWSGPALADLEGEPFARREADRLEELRIQAWEELLDLRVAVGHPREAIGELRRLLADAPGRERLWRLLMLALYADGRQGEALAAYQDARRYLADELGLDPSPELQELERTILTQEAAVAKPASYVGRPADRAIEDASTAGPAAAPMEPETSMRSTRRVVSVLHAEIERPHAALDPEVIDAADGHAADAVARAVERHGGTIHRVGHDGVTAVFGLSAAREDDALRAVRAAAELRDEPGPAGGSGVVLRIGVATGEVLAGPEGARAATLRGAPIELADRLAGRARPHEVLLAPETSDLVRGAASTEPAGLEPILEAGLDRVGSAARLLNVGDGDAIVRQSATVFVGRANELEALVGAFERVVADRVPGLVNVLGVPGVGKSRLVAEALARISGDAVILRSRCLPYGDGITYWPVRDLVLAATGIGPGEPAELALRKLERVVAQLDGADQVRDAVASIVGLNDAPFAADDVRWAVRRFFEALAADRPLVLLVDDLQWAEPVLVELLDHVLDLGHGPMLLIAVARPELVDTRPEWLTRSSLATVRLDSLDDDDAAALLEHLAPELPSGPLRSSILATAEGNPLFVEQFVAYLADHRRADDRARSAWSASDLPIPPTIGALLAARLDRLPAGEQRVLEEAAVVGRTFWTGALADQRSDADRAELPRRLARLARRDLIRPERSSFPDADAYRFRHLLIRDAAYARLPKRDRAELHERFAGWLEDRSGAHPGEFDLIVGYHLEQAVRYRLELGDDPADQRPLAERAVALLGSAGLAAEERGDPHAAISLLRRALDIAVSGPQRIPLLVALRSALRAVDARDEADAVERETSTLLAMFPDEGVEHRRWLADAWLTGQGTIARAEQAAAFYERAGDGDGRIHALEVTARLHVGQGRITPAVELLDRAIAVAFEIGRPDRATVLAARSFWIFPDSHIAVPELLDRTRRYLDLAGGNRYARALLLMELGRLEAMSGIEDTWRSHFEAAKAIIDDLGLLVPLGQFSYPAFLGSTELAAGDPARVVDLLIDSCSALERFGGDAGRLATLAPITAQAMLAVGRLDVVERYAFWGREIAADDDVDTQVGWRQAISGLRTLQGRDDEAIELAREAIVLLAESGAVVVLARANMRLASALRAAGEEDSAIRSARDAKRLASAKGDQAALRKIDAFLTG